MLNGIQGIYMGLADRTRDLRQTNVFLEQQIEANRTSKITCLGS